MKFLSKIESAFSYNETAMDDHKDNSESQNDSSYFTNKELLDKSVKAFSEIENTCFPNNLRAIYTDISNQFVNKLAFSVVTPQGLKVSVYLGGVELQKADKEERLVSLLKDELSEKIFNYLSNLMWNESRLPRFISENGLQYSNNLTYFHINEDLLMTAALNMYFSRRFDNYPSNTTQGLKAFSTKDLKDIRYINRRIQNFLGLKKLAPLNISTKTSGCIVECIRWQLSDCKGQFQFNLYPIDPGLNISADQSSEYFYLALKNMVIKQLSALTPEYAKVKYHTMNDLKLEEIAAEIKESLILAKSLPDTYSQLINKF